MMQRHDEDDAAATEQRVRRARRRCEADQREDLRVRCEQAEEGERRHLRRDHHREHEGEGERALAPDIGDAERQRDDAADEKRAERRERGRFQRVPGRGHRRAARHLREGLARRELPAGREGGRDQPEKGQAAEQQRDRDDERRQTPAFRQAQTRNRRGRDRGLPPAVSGDGQRHRADHRDSEAVITRRSRRSACGLRSPRRAPWRRRRPSA